MGKAFSLRLGAAALLTAALFSVPGCHFQDAKRLYGTDAQLERLEKAVAGLTLNGARAVAGDPTAIAPAVKSTVELLSWIGGFVATACVGVAAGHARGKAKERAKRKTPTMVLPPIAPHLVTPPGVNP